MLSGESMSPPDSRKSSLTPVSGLAGMCRLFDAQMPPGEVLRSGRTGVGRVAPSPADLADALSVRGGRRCSCSCSCFAVAALRAASRSRSCLYSAAWSSARTRAGERLPFGLCAEVAAATLACSCRRSRAAAVSGARASSSSNAASRASFDCSVSSSIITRPGGAGKSGSRFGVSGRFGEPGRDT